MTRAELNHIRRVVADEKFANRCPSEQGVMNDLLAFVDELLPVVRETAEVEHNTDNPVTSQRCSCRACKNSRQAQRIIEALKESK